ncbi:EcsC family protein [Mesoflavibacter profundi]|uniref:EcsC family protein n=1 Tax=Mesoflavibacter profundi TaxID=2708110 RepID=UPI0035159186
MENSIMEDNDVLLLKEAKQKMQDISWAMKGLNLAASTVSFTTDTVKNQAKNWLSKKYQVKVDKVINKVELSVEKALHKLIKANLKTIKTKKKFKKPSKKTYKLLTTTSGAVSGFFGSTTGFGTLIFTSEFTLTTKFMLRSIMDIARSHGEDLYNLETQKACFEVFALGGESKSDDDLDIAYYSSRVALNQGLDKVTAEGLKKLVGYISKRLSVVITEKFLAQALPLVGAIGGGTINLAFISHYQKMAEAHFTIRSLERKYGKTIVESTYTTILINQ